MAKTQKELAFLRELYIAEEWTKRFTDLINKHFDFADGENLLYINAGTGAHAFELDEKFGSKVDIFATCQNEDILNIAREKAVAISSNVDFSMIRFEDDSFDAVLADASFVSPKAYEETLDEAVRVAKNGGNIGVLSVTAGSFGEVFSLLWEVLFNQNIGENGREAEQMIAELPTISDAEATAKRLGLENIKTFSGNEVFEFDNGSDFINSPLVEDFLLPVWLEPFADEEKPRITKGLSDLIDKEDGNLSFRFMVKALLLTGEKV
jgi:ubiquinone/menaquinone biosynthesis C-methylase UbiE